MSNPHAGEVSLWLGGAEYACRLTLGSLAATEGELPEGGWIALIERFEAGRFGITDVMAVLWAGLRGGGWAGSRADLAEAAIGGGVQGAVQVAGQLLLRGFGGAP